MLQITVCLSCQTQQAMHNALRDVLWQQNKKNIKKNIKKIWKTNIKKKSKKKLKKKSLFFFKRVVVQKTIFKKKI